jgi:histidinol dehydrogenase
MTLANSKDTPKRAEASFKKEERAREGAQAMLEYEAEGRAVREKTARLRALRLAAEAGKKDARVKAAVKQAKDSVKKVADKVTGGAKLKAKGKAARTVGKELEPL